MNRQELIRRVPTRFASKVGEADDNGCLPWIAARNSDGYGSFWTGESSTKAHRFAFEQIHGAIPPGAYILHSCDNRPCVNPDHLRIGTHAENMRDMAERGRTKGGPEVNAMKTHCPRGHEYNDANAYPVPTGGRSCRACGRASRTSIPSPLVPIGPTRDHLQMLVDSGWTMTEIAAESGLGRNYLYFLRRGLQAQVRTDTAERILAVMPRRALVYVAVGLQAAR